tara:strand:+ start:21737 stop:21985 length:249 start_codon:yes stop_codon:yes gene_type:complete
MCDEWDNPPLSDAEIIQLRIRVIALENILLSLLPQASDNQHESIAEMAELISPRPGATQHPLTIHAATQMNQMVERAIHVRQ